MTLFEPLFLLLVLAGLAAVAVAGVAVLRGQWRRAGRILFQSGVVAAAYTIVVLAVALASPRRVYQIGDDQCFDDWCIAVTRATHAVSADGLSYEVTLRLTSRALRVTQRERGAIVYLEDARHRRFNPAVDSTAAAQVPLDVALTPRQSIVTTRHFVLPADATHVGLVFAHTGLPIGAFVIGENQVFHRRAVLLSEERGAGSGNEVRAPRSSAVHRR